MRFNTLHYSLNTCVSSMRRTLRTAPLVPMIIIVLVALSTRATIASEVALISAVTECYDVCYDEICDVML
jgi:hypothetical protein